MTTCLGSSNFFDFGTEGVSFSYTDPFVDVQLPFQPAVRVNLDEHGVGEVEVLDRFLSRGDGSWVNVYFQDAPKIYVVTGDNNWDWSLVPEPASDALVTLALLALIGTRRQRKRGEEQ